MKNLIYLLFTATLFLATACDKEDDIATTSTSNNHDILRCKINGENWTPAGGGPDIISPISMEYFSDIKRVKLIARNTIQNDVLRGSINFNATVEDLQVETQLSSSNSLLLLSNSSNAIECKYYENVDTNYYNFIKLTELDSINLFIKGEFQFSIINECQDTTKVTDGFFDLNYIY